MGLYVPSLPSHEYFRGVEVANIGPRLDVQELAEFVGSLVIPAHFDAQGKSVAEKPAKLLETRTMTRSPEDPDRPYDRDRFWHTDRGYWDEVNQFATVLYAQHLDEPAAGTEFIDTHLLLEAAGSGFAKYGYPDITKILALGTTVFFGNKYYTSSPPLRGADLAIEKALSKKGHDTLEQLLEQEAKEYPPKRFPTIPIHPFRGNSCIMIDEALTIDIEGTELPEAEIQFIIAQFIKDYLALPSEALEGRSYYKAHAWEEGQVVIWPQIGTLHRAQASPVRESTRSMLRFLIN